MNTGEVAGDGAQRRERRSGPRSFLALGIAATLAALLGGCGSEEAPPFPEGQGQEANSGIAYPSGPYGVTKGSTIDNYSLVGFPDSTVAADPNATVPIQLSDFYNPTGEDVFPEGSVYGAGQPKPRALLIDISALWCSPCQFEAQKILPGLYAKYQPLGAELLMNIAESGQNGVPAAPKDLKSWVTTFKTPFPAGIDSTRKLPTNFSPGSSFPVNILVDTRDMKIVYVLALALKEEDDPLLGALDALLAQ